MNVKPRSLNTRKLLKSKWTSVTPKNKEKHFLVTLVFEPALPETNIEFIELEAVHSKVSRVIAWRELQDTQAWQQGWF